ncbi:sulfotransferase [Winogradskyella sp.]|uniref:sulfotransferase n=1 Tax=Winogradskyella sp. TaxID=1883156 RepID=UPI0026127AD4|nr:sulfotransferase [Winogradskyella sp.]
MIKALIRKIYRKVKSLIRYFKIRNKPKVFCIGQNKTGTTSMAKIFQLLDMPVGNQRKAELLAIDVLNGNYDAFFKYVKNKGLAFQDVPFSKPNIYKILDKKFPDSKFILTIRDSPEIWYNSLIKFHAKLFGNGEIPKKSDLIKAKYVYPGWMWEMNRLNYKTPEEDIYNKKILIKQHIDYNNDVIDYFKDQPEKLLVVNLKEKNAAEKISNFLQKKLDTIPWENKT